MASTNKTAGLGLNQWVLNDQFKTADFNEDNRRIDEAVGARPSIKLLDVTTKTAVTAVELNLLSINVKDFTRLTLFSLTNNSKDDVALRVNKSSANYSYQNGINGWQTYGPRCSFYYGYVDFELCGTNIVMHDFTGVMRPSVPISPKNLQTIDIIQNGDPAASFPIGTRFVLVGVKI